MATPNNLGWIWWTWGMATIARYNYYYYIVRAMRLYRVLYLNYFIAKLSNLEIIIIFCSLYYLSLIYIL